MRFRYRRKVWKRKRLFNLLKWKQEWLICLVLFHVRTLPRRRGCPKSSGLVVDQPGTANFLSIQIMSVHLIIPNYAIIIAARILLMGRHLMEYISKSMIPLWIFHKKNQTSMEWYLETSTRIQSVELRLHCKAKPTNWRWAFKNFRERDFSIHLRL